MSHFQELKFKPFFEHDFKEKSFLDNARNWLIIGVWTGARVSDLLQFTKNDIQNGFIEYTAKKTKLGSLCKRMTKSANAKRYQH